MRDIVSEGGRMTYLSTPIAEVVDGSNVPPARLVEVCKESADDRRTEMANVEALRDVGRGVLQEQLLALPNRVRAIF
jgi:hypothetical protein